MADHDRDRPFEIAYPPAYTFSLLPDILKLMVDYFFFYLC